MPFGPTHTLIRSLATAALGSFYCKIQVEGSEFIPKEEEGPVLVLANHWNSAVDVSFIIVFPSTLTKIGRKNEECTRKRY